MTTARKDIISENIIGTYHITARCVRQGWLLDNNENPDRDYSHRKKWFYDYFELFSKAFCIDIGGYSIMSNHYHIILRNRPDLLEQLSDNQLAYRWLLIHPTSAARREKREKPNKSEIDHFLKNQKNIEKCKENLSCISSFMKELNQRISRRANLEEGIKGRFWEARFNSQLLADETAVLACMIYVDLNPIRAKITDDISKSKFTSAYDRSNAKTAKTNINEFNKITDNQKLTYKQADELKNQYSIANTSKWLTKIQRNETDKIKPILRMDLSKYLELLDFTGREIREDKNGHIPGHIETILDKMNVDHEQWITQIKHYGKWYYRVIGHANAITKKLKDTSQKWFNGIKQSSLLYKRQPEEI